MNLENYPVVFHVDSIPLFECVLNQSYGYTGRIGFYAFAARARSDFGFRAYPDASIRMALQLRRNSIATLSPKCDLKFHLSACHAWWLQRVRLLQIMKDMDLGFSGFVSSH